MEVIKDWRRPAAVLLRRQFAEGQTSLQAIDVSQYSTEVSTGASFRPRSRARSDLG